MSGLKIRPMPGDPRNGLLIKPKPYVYRGNGEDTLTGHLTDADLEPYRGEDAKTWLAPCGTPAAYTRHIRNCEPMDETCRQANSRRAADSKARSRQRDQRTAS